MSPEADRSFPYHSKRTTATAPRCIKYRHSGGSSLRAIFTDDAGVLSVEALDVNSSNVLPNGLDAPLPPLGRASNHPASLTPLFPSFRTTISPYLTNPVPYQVLYQGGLVPGQMAVDGSSPVSQVSPPPPTRQVHP
jgi:hypothetical protein